MGKKKKGGKAPPVRQRHCLLLVFSRPFCQRLMPFLAVLQPPPTPEDEVPLYPADLAAVAGLPGKTARKARLPSLEDAAFPPLSDPAAVSPAGTSQSPAASARTRSPRSPGTGRTPSPAFSTRAGCSSRRRCCHSADAPSPPLLQRLLMGEGVQQNDSLADC